MGNVLIVIGKILTSIFFLILGIAKGSEVFSRSSAKGSKVTRQTNQLQSDCTLKINRTYADGKIVDSTENAHISKYHTMIYIGWVCAICTLLLLIFNFLALQHTSINITPTGEWETGNGIHGKINNYNEQKNYVYIKWIGVIPEEWNIFWTCFKSLAVITCIVCYIASIDRTICVPDSIPKQIK